MTSIKKICIICEAVGHHESQCPNINTYDDSSDDDSSDDNTLDDNKDQILKKKDRDINDTKVESSKKRQKIDTKVERKACDVPFIDQIIYENYYDSLEDLSSYYS